MTYERGRGPLAFPRIVSDNYITAMGIPLRAGRDISPHDTPSGEPVMLVNETMARTLWPGEDPIGKVVLGPCAKERRVVGVVGEVRHLALEQSSGNEMYIPLRQCGDLPSADLIVRSSLPPEHMANAVRAALRPIAPNLPGNSRTLQQLVDKSVSPRSFLVLLLGGFAVFALVLASLGIHGMIIMTPISFLETLLSIPALVTFEITKYSFLFLPLALTAAEKSNSYPTIIDVRLDKYDCSARMKRLTENLKKRVR